MGIASLPYLYNDMSVPNLPTPYMLLRYSTWRTVRSRNDKSFRTSIADFGHVQPMLVPSPPASVQHVVSMVDTFATRNFGENSFNFDE